MAVISETTRSIQEVNGWKSVAMTGSGGWVYSTVELRLTQMQDDGHKRQCKYYHRSWKRRSIKNGMVSKDSHFLSFRV